MEMIYVDSKGIDQIGYDEAECEAHVIFKDGRHYVYSGVTSETWGLFMEAESKGTFLNAELKAKGYAYRQI